MTNFEPAWRCRLCRETFTRHRPEVCPVCGSDRLSRLTDR